MFNVRHNFHRGQYLDTRGSKLRIQGDPADGRTLLHNTVRRTGGFDSLRLSYLRCQPEISESLREFFSRRSSHTSDLLNDKQCDERALYTHRETDAGEVLEKVRKRLCV